MSLAIQGAEDAGIDTGFKAPDSVGTIGGQEVVVTSPEKVAIQPYVEPNRGITLRQPQKEKLSNKILLPSELDDEFSAETPSVIKPMTRVVIENEGGDIKEKQDITDQIAKDFEHLSRTRKLEIGTYRCKILQEIVDNMVKTSDKWRGHVQVAIINKGEIPEAMAYPDGTILVSQALFNLLGENLDEIAAVLGHEVEHLLNETTLRAAAANRDKGSPIGVQWFHEMLSDFGSADLLNKNGFRTLSIATTLEKLKVFFSNARGYEHQSSALRAIEVYMQHSTRDFENSNKSPTPLPQEFVREIIPTNLEYAMKIIRGINLEAMDTSIRKLCPHDLGELIDNISKNRSYFNFDDKFEEDLPRKIIQRRLLKAKEVISKVVSERLKQFNFDEKQIAVFLFVKDLLAIKSLEQITGLIETAARMNKMNEINKALEVIFESYYKRNPLLYIMEWAEDEMDYFNKSRSLFSNKEGAKKFFSTINSIILTGDTKLDEGIFVNKEGKPYNTYSGVGKLPKDVRLQYELDSRIIQYIEEIIIRPSNKDNKNSTPSIKTIGEINRFLNNLKKDGYDVRIIYNRNKFLKYIEDPTRLLLVDEFKKVFNKSIVIEDTREKEVISSKEEFVAKIQKFTLEEALKLLKHIYSDNEVLSANDESREAFKTILKATIDKFLNEALDKFQGERFKKLDSKLVKLLNAVDYFHWKQDSKYKGKIFDFSEPSKSIDEILEDKNIDVEAFNNEVKAEMWNTNAISLIRLICEGCYGDEDIVTEAARYFMESKDNGFNPELCTTEDLFKIMIPVFEITNKEDEVLLGAGIEDFDSFTDLPYIQTLIKRASLKSTFNSLKEFNIFHSKQSELINSTLIHKNAIFSDSLENVVLFLSFRSELVRLTQPGKINVSDFSDLIEILDKYFPDSTQKTSLIKKMELEFLKSPKITIEAKIDFFQKRYKQLGVEGATIIGDQISDKETFSLFQSKCQEEFNLYLTGKKSLEEAVGADVASSGLVKRAEDLIMASSPVKKDSIESSTKLAEGWMYGLMLGDEPKARLATYLSKERKIVIKSILKTTFKSFSDIVTDLKSTPLSHRLVIAVKALGDSEGMLSTVKKRKILFQTLREGLGLKNKFIVSILEKAILLESNSELRTLAAAKMLAPLLFSGLSTSSVNLSKLKGISIGDIDKRTRFAEEFHDDLPHILSETTRNLVAYGFRYINQPDSFAAKEAVKSADTYNLIVDNITKRLEELVPNKNDVDTAKSELSLATEAVIQAGESSAVFVRAMQMAVQVMDFSPAIRERLAKTQDSMVSQTKLGFWDNMLRRSQLGEEEYDPNFATFMKERFVSLDEYLGGGSLFTTYAATIKGKDGEPEKVVIKMLNPNAEAFIEDVYKISANILKNVIVTNVGETRDQAKLALTLLDLSYKWCLEDINDPNYIESDDMFRDTIDSFNESVGTKAIEASERIFTSKKIKVEVRSKGNTLNTLLLEKTGVEPSTKKFLIQRLSQFFDFQFIFAHKDKTTGKPIYKFHSDPHAGNYMSNVQEGGTPEPLGVIDRSMYIDINEAERNIFSLLKEGKGSQFVSEFINLCLDKNGLNPNERLKVKNKLRVRLALEKGKQKANHKENTSKFLEIIMSEFIKFGEKFSYNPDLPKGELLEEDQAVIKEKLPKDRKVEFLIDYFKKMPNRNSIRAYEDLKNDPVFQEFKLTFEGFTQTLNEMTDQGLLTRKAIDVPIKYRLMIRNIVAMQNLRKRFLS